MRIAILTPNFYIKTKEVQGEDLIIYGGAERYMYELCMFLQSMGHEVTVYQPFNPNTADSFGNPRRVEFNNIMKDYRGMKVMLISDESPAHYVTNPVLNMSFNEYTINCDLRIYFSTYMTYPQAVNPSITICHGIYWDYAHYLYNTAPELEKKEFLRRVFAGFSASDVCVAVDSNVKKVIQAMSAGLESKIEIIYNFVDTKKFQPLPEGKRDWEKIRVLLPRRLTILRGCNHFFEATNRYPQYEYWAVGQAMDKAAQTELRNHLQNVEGRTIKMWDKEMEGMEDIYPQADISVIPTRSCEGLSLSLLESMSCGLPVITTPVGGLGDAVIPGYNGIVCDLDHYNLGDAIHSLAQDEEKRRLFGRRNREIAVESFDVSIWKKHWFNLLVQFGVLPQKQFNIGGVVKSQGEVAGDALRNVIAKEPVETLDAAVTELKKVLESPEYKKAIEGEWVGPEKPRKPKLVAMMLTHNDEGRYLKQVIENTLKFCDAIVVLDDHSTDDTLRLLKNHPENDERLIWRNAQNSWENESELRKELFDYTLGVYPNCEWLIAIDSDELYEADAMAEQLPALMSQDKAEWIGFRFFDMWDEEHYRDDDIWPAGMSYAPRMFRVTDGMECKFANKKRHCGSVPNNVLKKTGAHCDVRVKHMGWARAEDRIRKYNERVSEDPNSNMFAREVYEAILDDAPTLVKWDHENPWQTSKATIAYPPGMEWHNMQQRPHHFMRLAAKERNRVFFGDDTAPGNVEVDPYLTVIHDWDTNPFIQKVDILYITSPVQMARCKNIRYKKLVYDCCDWMGGGDIDLIYNADYVFCASKMLYEKILNEVYGVNNDVTLNTKGEFSGHGRKRETLIYIPNACDYFHFSRTPNPQSDIVGYMGCIHPVMVDENIVTELAKHFRLLVIGQNKGVKFTNPNIHEAGHVPYNRLPEYLKQCVVGIIPFRTDTDYLRYSAPIKVYEYLAAGRPVVASPIPELMPLAEKGLIRVVANDDLEGWIRAVDVAMLEYRNTRGATWAKSQTWEARWEVLRAYGVFDKA